jgi:GNAT superfamily N-acetyltransferase
MTIDTELEGRDVISSVNKDRSIQYTFNFSLLTFNLEVLHATDRKAFNEFIDLPFRLYRGNPCWVPPLIKDIKEQFSQKNPFFRHAEIMPFIAVQDGRVVGRIVAIRNDAHIDFTGERAGFFGFFECINDSSVCMALTDSVKKWLRRQNLHIMRGPMNFSTNEECGLLIEGFGEPPMIMMPYNHPYYKDLLDGCGLRKAKDLFAYIIEIPERLPDKIYRVAEIARKNGIVVRPINMKHFRGELTTFKKIYNSAWQRNWGFIPMTDEEIDYMAGKLKQIIISELTFIAEYKGEPVGFMMLLPDFNYILKRLNGRLFPFGIFKALWYSRRIRDVRLLLLGVTEGFRRRGVDALFFTEAFRYGSRKGYRKVEFSWILEDNYPVQNLIRMVDGRLYKRYRIYETEI